VLRQPTGIGVYANAVLPALQDFSHVLIPGGEEGTPKQRLKRLLWTQYELPRLARLHHASLIFTPAPEGYLGQQATPQVVMVHDLRPVSHPDRSLQSLYFCNWVPPLLRRCFHVITNSQYTAREIQRYTALPDSRISVTPLGYDDQVFKPAPVSSASQERPYLLHVGQAYPHKNLFRLIEAFARLIASYPELRLVLVGKSHPKETPRLYRLVKELSLQHHVEFRSYIPYSELPALYQGALGFVYPSLWEGFGLPILEAMACGTPVLTSFGSGTEEVAGKAAVLVDPTSVASIVEGLFELMYTPLDTFRKLGLERAMSYSWAQVQISTASILSLSGLV